MPEIRDLLTSSSRVVVLAHVAPDGDAVGSVTALTLALQQLNIVAYPVLKDPVPAIFDFLPASDQIGHELPDDADLCILLDMSDLSRSGFTEEIRKFSIRGKLITIDHHLRGDLAKLSTVYKHQEDASSVCEMLADLLPTLGVRITPEIATCLMNGLYTDTGGFQHQNATPKSLETASELMKRGGKLDTIARHVSHTKRVSALKLLGLALDRMYLTHGGSCAVSALTYADLAKCQATEEDIPGIANEMNAIPGVQIAVLLIETEPGLIRGTLRTGEGFATKVITIAKLAGGGGHPRAAGFGLSGRLVEKGGLWSVA